MESFHKENVLIVAGMVVSLFLFSAASCSAALTDLLAALKPVEGYVVKAHGRNFVIDIDAEQGLVAGDIIGVFGPGEELVHPVTNEVIGRLDELKGVLKVVRLRDGYSLARPMGDNSLIRRGDNVQRFGGLTGVFWDYSNSGKRVFKTLQSELTALNWQDYRTAQERRPPRPEQSMRVIDVLTFIYQDNTLEVRDGEDDLIGTYTLTTKDLRKAEENLTGQ